MVSIPTAVHTSGIAQAPVVKFEEHANAYTSDKVLRLLGCSLGLCTTRSSYSWVLTAT